MKERKTGLTTRLTALLLLTLMILALCAGCGAKNEPVQESEAPAVEASPEASEPAPSEEPAEEVEPEVIEVAFAAAGIPFAYVGEDGEPTGYEVEVFKLIDEMLPQYTFNWTPTSDDDLYLGLDTGKYDIGLKAAWYTAERAEKYLFPQNYDGAAAIGFVIRSELEGKITDLESIAKNGYKFTPFAPQNAQYMVVQKWNEEHPDMVIETEESDALTMNDAILWVAEDRYDAHFVIKVIYENIVAHDDAPYHELADDVRWVTVSAEKNWPLFSKDNTDLAAAYDEAITQLKQEGKLEELMLQFYGENLFEFLAD